MNTPMRVALVGCGSISGNHVAGILAAGQTLCALCDREEAAARTLMQKKALGELPVYTDFAAMLDREKPDAVHICTPHYLHAPMIGEALRRGIHVLCEKPLAISEEQLVQILEAEKNSTATLGVCLQNRYESNIVSLEKLSAGKVRAAFGDVVWKRDEDYYRSGDWRGKILTEGGGVMINQALHTLDLLQWICGMPTSVSAHIFNDHLKGVIEVEDTAAARFQLPDGRLFNFYATTGAGTSFQAHLRLKLDDGRILHAENDYLLCSADLSAAEDRSAPEGKSVWGVGHKRLIDDFYRCLQRGEKFPIDGAEGAKVIRLILAMYRSSAEGREVTV